MIPYQNPTIYLGNLRIDETITVLTDLIVVCVCVFAFFKTSSATSTKSVNLYRWFLLVTGLSTLVSAIIGHAFLYAFSFNAKIFGWITGITSVIFAQFAAILHTKSLFKPSTVNLLMIINALEIILAFFLLFYFNSFVVVEIHSAIGLILTVSILEYAYYQQSKSVLSKHMLLGIGVAVLAIVCHITKLAISVWFNHMDLSHIIIAIAIYVMYLGIKKELKINTLSHS